MPRDIHPSRALLYAALLLHTFLSAATYLIARRALTEIPPLPLGLFRFVLAGAVLALLLWRLLPPGRRLPPREQRRALWRLSFIAVPLNQGFFLIGLSLSSAGHAALLYSLTPVVVLLLSHAPHGREIAGAALALGGTLWVLLQRGAGAGAPVLGDALLALAVLAWALYMTGARRFVAEHGALPTTAWSLIGGTALFLPIGLAALAPAPARAQIASASAGAWLGLVYLALATSVIAYLLYYWALGKLAPVQVAVFSNLQPLATALLAHFTLGEQITPRFVAGAVIVMAGVVLTQSAKGAAP